MTMKYVHRRHPTVQPFRDYKAIAYMPGADTWLIRHGSDLELWQPAETVHVNTIELDNITLEFVRDVDHAYKVMDTQHNRDVCPGEIGRVYLDREPDNLDFQEIAGSRYPVDMKASSLISS